MHFVLILEDLLIKGIREKNYELASHSRLLEVQNWPNIPLKSIWDLILTTKKADLMIDHFEFAPSETQ